MTVVITMAGVGSRFKDRGYLQPKFRIRARGRTLMDWSLLSLRAFFDQRFIFACLDTEDDRWIRDAAQRAGIHQAVVSKRSGVSRGQAETAFDALTNAETSEPLWIYNIDTFVAPGSMGPRDLETAVGCIPVFPSAEPGMSFVRHGSGDDVAEIAEKRAISNWATVGLYGFSSAQCFVECYQEAYERNRIEIVRGERYIAPIYQILLMQGKRVVAPRLKGNDVNILGTPDQVLDFDPAAGPPLGSGTATP